MGKERMTVGIMVVIIALLLLPPLTGNNGSCLAQGSKKAARKGACDLSKIPGAVWWTTERKITIRQLAAYCAPVFWFSPDEPTLEEKEGKDLRLPETLPFQDTTDAPVVYYQYNRVFSRVDGDGPAYIADSTDKNNSIIDLHNVAAINLKFIGYFSREEGLGGHAHDVEPAEFKIVIGRSTGRLAKEYGIECDYLHYVVIINRVTAEAHGLNWFFNTLETDQYTKFPMHLLVEEGKHGMCTDKNGDGYYTPGYDVNKRVNDAWGVRDIIRGGALFTGSYQSWMAKVRRPEHRSFPPLPNDSPLRKTLMRRGVYAPNNAIYELRAFPAAAEAGDDHLLHHKMEEKEKLNWPEEKEISSLDELSEWVGEGRVLKSLSISFRADGDYGFSFVFPFFIVANFEDPMSGGFIVHRMYLKDKGLRDFGWMLLYTPSASRWIDSYFAAGAEWDTYDLKEPDPSGKMTDRKIDFVLETGIKFRVNITKAPPPLNFLGSLTDYWGLRAGVKNTGGFDIERLTYVVEVGAGVW